MSDLFSPPLASVEVSLTEPLCIQIILMSATINCREFAEYFGTPICGKMYPAYVFEVEGAPYAIDEFYLDDLRSFVPSVVRKRKTFADAAVLYIVTPNGLCLLCVSDRWSTLIQMTLTFQWRCTM